MCMCKDGFRPNLDCRPRGDLGLSDGGIPDDAISVSSTSTGYEKNVSDVYWIALYIINLGTVLSYIQYAYRSHLP